MVKDAHLIRWTKTIDAKGAFSKSLRDLLVQALQKVGINQELNVLCNDSTACLYTGLAEDPNSRLGVILGTGFNIAVMSPSDSTSLSRLKIIPIQLSHTYQNLQASYLNPRSD